MVLNKSYRNAQKILIIAVFLICSCILPVSAGVIAPVINQGGVIFIGEEGLNLTQALNHAHGNGLNPEGSPVNTKIGWWASGQNIELSSPIKIVNLATNYQSFLVNQSDFVGYYGNWYLIDNRTNTADLTKGGIPQVVAIITDPSLDLSIWDFDHANDASGKTVPWGEHLGFKIRTNMYQALDDRYRSPVYHTADDGYIDIKVRNESGVTLTELVTGPDTTRTLTRQVVITQPYFWPVSDGSMYWQTDALNSVSAPVYPVGTYLVWAESTLNNMKNNYKNAGADYTGKTISQPKTITLVTDAVKLEANRDSVLRGDRLSVTLTGRPLTQYYLWVKDDGKAGLPVTERPPSILPSAPVIQDLPTGSFTIGSHPVLNGNGTTIRDSVPPSTLSSTLHYAGIITSRSGTATVEIQTWNATRPATYTFHAEGSSGSDDTEVLVVEGNTPSPAINPDKVIANPRINSGIYSADSTDFKRINQGAFIFIGEEGLNVTAALNQAHGDAATPYGTPSNTRIGWWAAAYLLTHSSPTKTIDLNTRHSSLTVEPADFVGYTGHWYLIDSATGGAYIPEGGTPSPVFTLSDPSLGICVWDKDQNTDVSGRSVPQGERLTFQIDTNMYSATGPTRPDISGSTPGFITIKVKNENGATYNYLYQNNTTSNALTNQFVVSQPFFWMSENRNTVAWWGTDLRDSDYNFFYPQGTYVVWAESTLNNMKENYKNAGADYMGKTVSSPVTITLVTDRVTVEVNKDSVIRGKPFYVIVTGRPNTSYYLWTGNTDDLDSSAGNRPPVISAQQVKVFFDNPVDASRGIHPIGDYLFENGNGRSVFQDVARGSFPAGNQYNSTRYYARIVTSTSGTRTVEFMTDSNTRPREYTIRAEQNSDGVFQGDEANITVRDREIIAQYHANISYGTAPLSVQFTDTSQGAPVSWSWSFGDGTSSQVQNPIHTYTRSGVYSISLNASKQNVSDLGVIRDYVTVAAVDTSTGMGFDGIGTTDAQGEQQIYLNITDFAGTTNVSSDSVMIRNPGPGWEQMHILSNNISTSGGILQVTNISDIVLTSEPVTGSLDPDLLGTVNVSLSIALDRLVTGNNLTQRIISGANESVSNAFQLAAAGRGLNVDAVAYTLEVKNTGAINANLSTSGQFVPVVINMSVSHHWVNLHGGTSAIKIIRYSEEGKKQVLNTTFRFNDPESDMDYFTADSPEGLSIFGITSTSARPFSGETGSSETSDSDPYPDVGRPGTKAAVDAPIIPEVLPPASPASARTGARSPEDSSYQTAPQVGTTQLLPPANKLPDTGFPVPTFVIVLAGIVLLTGGVAFVRCWWIRRQNPALFKDYD